MAGPSVSIGVRNADEALSSSADEGKHFIEVSPDLEDIAGNNLIRPFEVDVSTQRNSNTVEHKPVRIEFEVHP